jgi:ethanolamine ammonia-lyase large subunit
MAYRVTLGGTTHEFRDLKTLLAKATPWRSGDRQVLGLRPAPEFEAWLEKMQIVSEGGRLMPATAQHALVAPQLASER